MLLVETAADMTERHRRDLAELAEMGMALARKLQAAAMAAEDPQQAADLAGAFHRISRSVRQSMALEAKLERDLRLGRYVESKACLEDAIARGVRRVREIKARLPRMIWTEAERSEAERMERKLSSLLAYAEYVEGFADVPIDLHIARIREQLGLPPKTQSPSAHPGESRDPSRLSTPQPQPSPDSAWIPASAGTSGGGVAPNSS